MSANKEQIREDRRAGMTHREIAEKHGVSRQHVSQICSQYDPARFRVVKESGCIYPNWRRWMNNEKCSKYELLRRMGLEPVPVNSVHLRCYMNGQSQPRKPYIDMLLKATGMTYEVMFAMEVDDGR